MLQKRATRLPDRSAPRSEPARLLGRTASLVAARICGSVLTLAYTLLLARMMAPDDLGLVMSAMSVAFLASVVASLNVESGSIRFLVRYLADGDRPLAAGFVAVGRRIVLASTVLLLPLWAGTWLVGGDGTAATVYAVAFATAPALAVTRLYSRHAGALDAVLRGALPRMLVRPALFTGVLGAGYLLGADAGPLGAMLLYLLAAVLVLGLQARLLRRCLAFAAGPADTGPWRLWVRTGVMLAPMLVMNEYMNYVVLGAAGLGLPAAGVAQLAIALSLQNILGFSVTAVDMAFGPRIAGALAADDRARCRSLLGTAALAKCVAVVGGGGAILALREPVLGLFGSHYAEAASGFLILATMPLVAAVLGPAALVLNILGRRRELLAGCALGIVALGIGTPLGGHLGGLDGAAAGAALGFLAYQAVLYLLCRRATGVDPSLFALAAGPRAPAREVRP